MPKKFLTLFLVLILGSCGFRVIYKERKDVDYPYINELAAIRIQKDRTRSGQELKNSLYDLLNPESLKVEPKYFLALTQTKTVSSTYTTSTGASGRNKVTLVVTYTLRNLETAATISSGSTSVNDNYDVTDNRYGTYTAEEYVLSNIARVAAQNIRNSIVNDLIEVRKKCEDKEFACPF